MIRSLAVKLSLLFMGIALVSVGVISIWVNQTVRAEFTSYCQRSCELQGTHMMGPYHDISCYFGIQEQAFLDAFRDSLWLAAIVAIIVAIALGLLFSRLISRPMRQLALSARRIATGDFSQRIASSTDDEIGEVSVAFNSMAEQLEKKENSRRQLLADTAHELRNPLSIIQGNLEAWLDGVISPTPEQVASVYDETVLLSRLITDLRELSLAEAGQLKLHQEATDLRDLVAAEISGIQKRCRDKGISISAKLPRKLPQLFIDKDRIRQVLHNLIDNAIRHTPARGSIKVSASADTPGWVTVSVSDTGSGIAAEDLPLVFDHFYKADRSRQRGHGGAGIGLALVKQLVELHGGSVWAESKSGKGSTFYLTLPVTP
jgi:signal transduction histidine kinase